MKPSLCVLFVIFGSSVLFAYDEKSMPDLVVPEQIAAPSLEVNVTHRFLRSPTAMFPDNFITLVNVKAGLRYAIWKGLEVRAEYVFVPREFTLDAGYSMSFPQLFFRAQAYLQYYGTKSDVAPYAWDYNALYQVNLQSTAILGRIYPVVNVAFDGMSKKFGIGTGLDVMVWNNIDVLGEYYPALGKRDNSLLTSSLTGSPLVNCFLAGIGFTTFGHHFMINVSNSCDMVMRRLMRGTASNTLYYGFTIQRLFSF
jgi:Membrane bound beta barrel domain (DUF5777)